MKKFVQAASVIAFTVASASVSAGWGGACLDADQHKAMVEQQQAQFQAMAEQRAKAMEEMMNAQRTAGAQFPGYGRMDPFSRQMPPMPEMPAFPPMPERPQFGQMPQMPEFPAMPERPQFGEMPQMPEFPAMPEAPQFGEMPAMPEMPAGFERGMPRVPPVLGQRAKDLEANRAERMAAAKARHDKAMTERAARRQDLAQRVAFRRFGPQPMWFGPAEAPVAPAAPVAAPAVEAAPAAAPAVEAAPVAPAAPAAPVAN